ncbi:MAG: hypothetical protein RLZZ618_2615 [Pseudomonadota bacterium]|jgi:drug/metabolite transporter (DMT)-like permease
MMQAGRRISLNGAAFGVAAVLLFSSFTLVSRLGLSSSLKVMDLTALRFGVGGLLLLPVLWRYGLPRLRWHETLGLALSGGVGFALLAYAGFALAPAAHGAVLLHGSLPLFTSLIGWIAASVPMSRSRVVGLSVILVGIVCLLSDTLGANTTRQWMGDGALLLASISWSAHGLLSRRAGLAPAHTASLVTVLSMGVFLPIYLLLPGKALLAAPWQELLLQGIFQGVLIAVVSIYIYSKAVATLGPEDTALFTAAVPCVTTLAAVFMLGETPTWTAWAGVLMVTAGMAISVTMRPGAPLSSATLEPEPADRG